MCGCVYFVCACVGCVGVCVDHMPSHPEGGAAQCPQSLNTSPSDQLVAVCFSVSAHRRWWKDLITPE